MESGSPVLSDGTAGPNLAETARSRSARRRAAASVHPPGYPSEDKLAVSANRRDAAAGAVYRAKGITFAGGGNGRERGEGEGIRATNRNQEDSDERRADPALSCRDRRHQSAGGSCGSLRSLVGAPRRGSEPRGVAGRNESTSPKKQTPSPPERRAAMSRRKQSKPRQIKRKDETGSSPNVVVVVVVAASCSARRATRSPRRRRVFRAPRALRPLQS